MTLNKITATNDITISDKGGQNIPSRHQINICYTVGKPSLDNSFTSEVSFEYVLVYLYESESLVKYDKGNLLGTRPLFKHLDNTLSWLEKKTSWTI